VAFKVNYAFERAERERAKQAKKAAKAAAKQLEDEEAAKAGGEIVAEKAPEDDGV
jgi:hypothetical protein